MHFAYTLLTQTFPRSEVCHPRKHPSTLGVFVLVAGLQPNGKAVPIMVVRGKFSNCIRTLYAPIDCQFLHTPQTKKYLAITALSRTAPWLQGYFILFSVYSACGVLGPLTTERGENAWEERAGQPGQGFSTARSLAPRAKSWAVPPPT